MNLINIPKKVYVNKRIPGRDWEMESPPLAFLISFVDETAPKKELESFKKRKATCDNWARSEAAEVLDNGLLTGFRIDTPVSRCSTENVVWRVIDPRGFQLEIYSDNMEEILKSCLIDKGEIKAKALWALRGQRVYLAVEGTKSYKNAIQFQENEKTTVYSVGDTIRKKKGNELITLQYLGKFWTVRDTSSYWSGGNTKIVGEYRYFYNQGGEFLSFDKKQEGFILKSGNVTVDLKDLAKSGGGYAYIGEEKKSFSYQLKKVPLNEVLHEKYRSLYIKYGDDYLCFYNCHNRTPAQSIDSDRGYMAKIDKKSVFMGTMGYSKTVVKHNTVAYVLEVVEDET